MTGLQLAEAIMKLPAEQQNLPVHYPYGAELLEVAKVEYLKEKVITPSLAFTEKGRDIILLS